MVNIGTKASNYNNFTLDLTCFVIKQYLVATYNTWKIKFFI